MSTSLEVATFLPKVLPERRETESGDWGTAYSKLCRGLICGSSELLLTSRLDGSFLECSLGPGFDSQPEHVSPGTSSLGWR
jgi:hypothetical protein